MSLLCSLERRYFRLLFKLLTVSRLLDDLWMIFYFNFVSWLMLMSVSTQNSFERVEIRIGWIMCDQNSLLSCVLIQINENLIWCWVLLQNIVLRIIKVVLYFFLVSNFTLEVTVILWCCLNIWPPTCKRRKLYFSS